MPSMQQPLQVPMLEHLPIKTLLALCQACSTARALVDEGTCPQWLRIAQQLQVPQQQLPQEAQHAPAVHAVLRDQAALLANIRQGRTILVRRGDLGIHAFTRFSWASWERSGISAHHTRFLSCGF